MELQKIAVIGSGIAGLSAAWLLSRRHQVTLYEADRHLGGHANTAVVNVPEGPVAVDTGFIVYNERNYPNLTALFGHLGVATHPAEMSFALSLDRGAYEYSASVFSGFFGQPRTFFSFRHWQLLGDILRFFRTSQVRVAALGEGVTLGAFLKRERYSASFIENHIIPMGAAIWSTTTAEMLSFPASSFVDFYANHGMLRFTRRPKWRTVTGGSRRYVDAMIADGGFETLPGVGVSRVCRHDSHVHIEDVRGVVRPFDQVVMATHADQALRLLESPDPVEARLLSQFGYQTNRAVLHRDRRWMPRRRRLWSAWNYLKTGAGPEQNLCVTYWMNRLQGLPTDTNLFVTLNPPDDIHPKAVEAEIAYDHPVFDADAIMAQKHLWSLQGRRRTWYCGAHFGYGFHEDGIQSGLAVAERLGGVRRPWSVPAESGRITLAPDVFVEAAE